MSIWGEDEDAKTALFNERVLEIETRNQALFNANVNRINGKSPDSLNMHFMTTFDGYKRTIGFLKSTYIPKNIQEEVIDAFKLVFSDK